MTGLVYDEINCCKSRMNLEDSSPVAMVTGTASNSCSCIPSAVVDISHDAILLVRTFDDDIIDRIDTLPSYEEIFVNYLLKNKPFILGKEATQHWRSRQEWVMESGEPNLMFLKANFGQATVPVANCGKEQFCAQPKSDMTVSEYTQYWENYMTSGYPSDMENLYLKDWHFTRDFPDYSAYETPVYFRSDWLNEFWDSRDDNKTDDYRFVYMGPKGSWTPFHADVFRSYSWSANICGQKKWILLPAGEEEKLRDCHRNLAYDITSPEITDSRRFPRNDVTLRTYEVIQEAGEIIFVPSGWHHQVHNLEDTISINHNWINGCNFDICWTFITSNLGDVQREIMDCRDMEGWHEQCQVILKASSGISYAEFYQFLHTIAQNRIATLRWKNRAFRKESGCPCQPDRRRPSSSRSNSDGTCANCFVQSNAEFIDDISCKYLACGGTLTYELSSNSEEISNFDELHMTRVCACSSCAMGDKISHFVSEKHENYFVSCLHCSPQGNAIVAMETTQMDSRDGGHNGDNCNHGNSGCHDDTGGCHKIAHHGINNVCTNHLLFDLRRLRLVLESMLSSEEFRMLNFESLPSNPNSLVMDIKYYCSN